MDTSPTCNNCYNPAACRHISNCSLPLSDAECYTDTEQQLHQLDRYYRSITDQFCKGVTCCEIVPCCTLNNWPPPPETETYPPMFLPNTTSHGQTDFKVLFQVFIPSLSLFVFVFIIACLFHLRNKRINNISKLDGETEIA